MKKKILGISALTGIGLLLFRYISKQSTESAKQAKLQNEKEVKSLVKRELDFSPYYDDLRGITPERMDELDKLIFEKSLEDIQRCIHNRELSCKEVVLYYVDRIKQYDEDYNTVIQLNPNALEYAKELDEKISSGAKLGKLFGTVVLIKDNISECNMNTSAGSYALKDLETKRDSFVVKCLKDEDAIILGKNNLSEWANFMTSPVSNGFSALGGQTKNPYGKFDVGGSSSGSAASVALNFASISLGTETTTSVIYPSSQNSVVGFKPTLGLISRDLVIPLSMAQDTVGIIGRSVLDVQKIFECVVGTDKNDLTTKYDENIVLRSINKNEDYIKGKRVGFIDDGVNEKKKVVEELKNLGAEVIEVELKGDTCGIDQFSVLNYGIVNDVKDFLNNIDVKSKVHSLSEIVSIDNEDPKNRAPYGSCLQENALKVKLSEREYENIVKKNFNISSKILEETMEEYDLDALVSIGSELSKIYAPALCPAVTVPSGYKVNGEPFGVTFVGLKYDDTSLLSTAYSYEKNTQHRVIPKFRDKI